MNELATTDVTIVNPRSGEALTLDSPTGDLGQCLADLREFKALVQEQINAITREILARQDRDATWTTPIAGGLKLVGSSPAPTEEWDGAELRTNLIALVDAGVLSIEAVDNAVEQVITFKPKKAGINKLRALGGDVRDLVDGLARTVEKDRRVTVSRSAG